MKLENFSGVPQSWYEPDEDFMVDMFECYMCEQVKNQDYIADDSPKCLADNDEYICKSCWEKEEESFEYRSLHCFDCKEECDVRLCQYDAECEQNCDQIDCPFYEVNNGKK